MTTPSPRKKPRSKLKKINFSVRDKWKHILKDVEKKEIPVTFLQAIAVTLIDGTVVDINIKELIMAGTDPDDIEIMIEAKLKALDDIIHNVDFSISIDDVVNTVQPVTDELLKDL